MRHATEVRVQRRGPCSAWQAYTSIAVRAVGRVARRHGRTKRRQVIGHSITEGDRKTKRLPRMTYVIGQLGKGTVSLDVIVQHEALLWGREFGCRNPDGLYACAGVAVHAF